MRYLIATQAPSHIAKHDMHFARMNKYKIVVASHFFRMDINIEVDEKIC